MLKAAFWLFSAVAMSSSVSAGVIEPQNLIGQQCYFILGENTVEGGQWVPATNGLRGSALIRIAQDGIHLWFKRDAVGFTRMTKGDRFDDVARDMLDQGIRITTTDNAGLHFGNGQTPVEAQYTILIKDGIVSGTIRNPQGQYFSARGNCGR
jgi:hypothetical protein